MFCPWRTAELSSLEKMQKVYEAVRSGRAKTGLNYKK